MLLSIINRSTVVKNTDLAPVVAALDIQLAEFCAAWQMSKPVLRVGLTSGAVPVYILDDSDQADALGYHDVDPSGRPLARVFAKTDKQYGLDWRVTLSHEVLEIVADPWCNATVQTGNQQFVALEVCDPVEADSIGQKINGITLSDWVYPAWFVAGSKGPWDRTGKLTRPLSLASGGYVSIWTPAKGWSQTTARATGPTRATMGHRMSVRSAVFGSDPVTFSAD